MVIFNYTFSASPPQIQQKAHLLELQVKSRHKLKYLIPLFFPLFSCQAQLENKTEKVEISKITVNEDSLAVIQFYQKNSQNTGESKTIGTVSNGKLVNGAIMPFYGPNFTYFDRDSYLGSRAFTSDGVKKIVLNTYAKLYGLYPSRKFFLMELSNREGGKLYPHHTHQNGLSVDFMMPKLKNGEPNYDLDTLGKQHYFLEFNDRGEYLEDTSIKIDFDLIAKHILLLNEEAKKEGYSIEKVIIKIEYKDDLFATPNGKELKKSGIYVVNSLTPMVNAIHDDHFHIDFKKNGQ
jgi:penicillin-insensitive murein DD-endopeptidase